MDLHREVVALLPQLTRGLEVAVGDYGGRIVADGEGLAHGPEGVSETGTVRLASKGAVQPDGPTVAHRWTMRGPVPGLELDLSVTNGEVTGPRTPHLDAARLLLRAPDGWSVIPRFDWIEVSRVHGSLFRIGLGCPVAQLVRLDVQLALVPDWLVSEEGPHPAIAEALARLPWLREGPGFVDGLPRAFPEHAVGQWRRDQLPPEAEYLDWIRADSDDYLEWGYGGATGGMSIRFDFGAEYAYLPVADQYRLMQRWSWEIHRRPQRCYLTRHGEPLEWTDAAPGLNLTIGPSERSFPNEAGNPYGFDEGGVPGWCKGSIDLQHGPRWFGPDAYLVQRFGDPGARDRLFAMAAAARLDCPDPVLELPGRLNRAHGWNAELQATIYGHEEAAWLGRFLAACDRDQTEHGGVCAWDHNKEATAYAPAFVADRDGVPESSVSVVPVTQSYQETILARARWLAGEDGEGARRHLRFICAAQRAPGAPGPWYRTALDGSRLSWNASTFYHGEALALAKHLGMAEADAWIRDFTGGASDPVAWLKARPAHQWRNRYHLIALLEG